MRLSVIIVSYNVYPFLDNCLRSVQQALAGINGEIIVVDNASVDRTPQLVIDHFPNVRLIANSENSGFAKANNQGIEQSKGEFVVLLNPDTIVSEDTFSKCLAFMDHHPEAGALGVRMLDGSGRFLPESKRGFPTLRATFTKMTGIYKLFPRSSFLNSYYKGEVDELETAEVDVLCGAFMFIRRDALDKTGFLDERFFMYGEDIDLSFRIHQAGYSIYYLPSTSIIHYKGESTRKSSLNYILTFYKAMLLFINKHRQFSGQKILIRLAIYLHGGIRFVRHLTQKWWPPLLDGILLAFSFFIVSVVWANYYYQDSDYFNRLFYLINIPLYAATGVMALFLNGAYDKPYSIKASWIGFGWAVLSILVIYALLPISMRTSRMVIVLGAIVYMILLAVTRKKLSPWKTSSKSSVKNSPIRAVIVGEHDESNRIRELINRSQDNIEIAGTVSPSDSFEPDDSVLGGLNRLHEIVRVHKVKEIIFSAQDVPFSKFTKQMTELGPSLRYMLAASATMNIVGSMSSETSGESYAIHVHFRLSHPSSKRAKRIFDLLSAILLLLASPILYFMLEPRKYLWANIFSVISGKRTWISYDPSDPMISSLPILPKGILHPVYPGFEAGSGRRKEFIHYVYARDYHWTTDLALLSAQWRKIGKQPLNYA